MFIDIVRENITYPTFSASSSHSALYLQTPHFECFLWTSVPDPSYSEKNHKKPDSMTFKLISVFAYLNPFAFRNTVDIKLSYTEAINLNSAPFLKVSQLEVGRSVPLMGKHPWKPKCIIDWLFLYSYFSHFYLFLLHQAHYWHWCLSQSHLFLIATDNV